MLSSILLDYKTSSQEAEEAYCNTKRFIVNVHNDVRRWGTFMGHISCEKGTRPSHLSAALKAIDSFQYDKTGLKIE